MKAIGINNSVFSLVVSVPLPGFYYLKEFILSGARSSQLFSFSPVARILLFESSYGSSALDKGINVSVPLPGFYYLKAAIACKEGKLISKCFSPVARILLFESITFKHSRKNVMVSVPLPGFYYLKVFSPFWWIEFICRFSPVARILLFESPPARKLCMRAFQRPISST